MEFTQRDAVFQTVRTMSHIVDSCPVTKLDGGLSRLHSADDDDVVAWIMPTMTPKHLPRRS